MNQKKAKKLKKAMENISPPTQHQIETHDIVHIDENGKRHIIKKHTIHSTGLRKNYRLAKKLAKQ